MAALSERIKTASYEDELKLWHQHMYRWSTYMFVDVFISRGWL